MTEMIILNRENVTLNNVNKNVYFGYIDDPLYVKTLTIIKDDQFDEGTFYVFFNVIGEQLTVYLKGSGFVKCSYINYPDL